MSGNPGRIAALALAITAGALMGCPGSQKGNSKASDGGKSATLTVFALAEVRGQIEPCGCTTDPLGDLARTARLVSDARAAGPVLVLDAGSLLYSKRPVPDHLIAQEELKADLLATAWTDTLKVAAIGLGPMDLARGADKVRLPRQAVNVAATAGVPLEAPRVLDVGGTRVGVFGVVSAELAPGIEVSDPVEAARAAVATLAADKPQLVVALLTMSRKDAVKLLGTVDGIQLAVLGMGRESPEPDAVNAAAEQVGGAWLLVPANRGQVVPRLAITVRDGGGAGRRDRPGGGRRARRRARRAHRDADRRARGVRGRSRRRPGLRRAEAAGADVAAGGARRARRAPAAHPRARQLVHARAGAHQQGAGVRRRRGDREARVQPAAAGDANVAASEPAMPAPRDGEAGYVGVEECADCHAEEVTFWETTRHQQAWETLEVAGKQFDHDCTSCHVTGWNQPGGAGMADNEALRDVQCEVCHGPGSLHAEAESDAAYRKTIRREPPAELCAQQCHTSEHSDTFQYEAYLRDVTGPGHAGKRRKALGDGPTGRELRAAGLLKAGATIGEGCRK